MSQAQTPRGVNHVVLNVRNLEGHVRGRALLGGHPTGAPGYRRAIRLGTGDHDGRNTQVRRRASRGDDTSVSHGYRGLDVIPAARRRRPLA